MTIDKLIQSERRKNNILQKELAYRMNVSKKVVSDWENALIVPSEENTIRIAELLGGQSHVFLEARTESLLNRGRVYTVYKHTSPKGLVYIGITSQRVSKRWQYGGGYEGNPHFMNAIKKYGWDSFSHEILYSDLSEEEAKKREIELIALYKSNERKYGYNISLGGDTISEESKTKAKVTREINGITERESIRMKNRWADPNIRSEIIQKMQNKPRTEEQKEHYRSSSARKGNPLPDETKRKLSDKARLRVGELAVRSQRVVAVNPFTGKIDLVFVSAREAAISMKSKTLNDIASICRGEGNKRGYKYGYFWCWENDYFEGKFPIISEGDITDKGKLSKQKAENRKPENVKKVRKRSVLCIETGVVFESMKAAGNYYDFSPEMIARQIEGRQKTAGGFTWEYIDLV